jgi:hypothetical protein
MKDFLQFIEVFQLNLLSPNPSIQIITWQKEGTLKKFLKPLNKCVGVTQDDKFHVDDVFQHCVKTCDQVPPDPALRWAGVLHDIGKAQTRDTHIVCRLTYPQEKKVVNYCKLKKRRCFAKCENAIIRVTFYKHELASEKLAKVILRLYKVNPNIAKPAIDLIANHGYNYDCHWTDRALDRFIKKTKITLNDLLAPAEFPLFQLRIADRTSRGLEPITQKQLDFENKLRSYFEGNGRLACKSD